MKLLSFLLLLFTFALTSSGQAQTDAAADDVTLGDSLLPVIDRSGFIPVVTPHLFWDSLGVNGFAAAAGIEWYWIYSPQSRADHPERSSLMASAALTLEGGYRSGELYAAPMFNLHGGFGLGPFLPLFIGGAIGPRFSESGIDLWGRLSAGVAFGPLKIGIAINKRLAGRTDLPDMHYGVFIDIPTNRSFFEDSVDE